MNIELQKEIISVPSRLCEMSSNQSVDLEINLPDYCSDIKRILRCFVIPGITSAELTGDRASAKGDITIRLVYVGEGEKIDCYEQNVDLSVYTDIKNLPENPVLTAYAKTQYVNCRAASQRRFVVGASVSVTFSVYSGVQSGICQKGENEFIETKNSSAKAVSKCAVSQKLFDLSETVALDEKKKPVGKIISVETVPMIESTKTVSGKILIKGELECKIVYCSDTKEKTVEKIYHTMPISQIVEVSGIDDTYKNEIALEVCSVAANAKTDSSGSNMLVELAAKLGILVTGTMEEDICFVTDCYCTKYESKAEYKSFDFKKSVAELKSKKGISSTIDVSEQNLKDLIDLKVISVSKTYSSSGRRFEGKSSVLFGILFEDTKEKLQYIERNADFDFDCELEQVCEKIICEPNIVIRNASATTNASKITVVFDAEISGIVYSVISEKILENIIINEDEEKELSDAAVTVYYCSKGESIWDIAKRYNTSEKLIAQENLIDSEFVPDDRMMIIPCI